MNLVKLRGVGMACHWFDGLSLCSGMPCSDMPALPTGDALTLIVKRALDR